jgi:hypothetical protein
VSRYVGYSEVRSRSLTYASRRFLPNAGEFMLNVLDGISNGEEKDQAWGWKESPEWKTSTRELRDLGPVEVKRSQQSWFSLYVVFHWRAERGRGLGISRGGKFEDGIFSIVQFVAG